MVDAATNVEEMDAFPRYVAVGQLAQCAQLHGLAARTKPPMIRSVEAVAEEPENLVRLPPGTGHVRKVLGPEGPETRSCLREVGENGQVARVWGLAGELAPGPPGPDELGHEVLRAPQALRKI